MKKLRIPIIIFIFLIVLTTLALWAQSGISSKPEAKINQEFSIQARTKDKLRVRDATLAINLVDAQEADNLLVQGKRARTRDGKTFLIINMEVENSYSVPLYTFPVDLMRLVREDGKKVAPSVHQGTVEVRPISTKKSNVGFVVDPSEKNFKIEFGELNDEKKILDISFK
ncbi:MAG: hypothetical protein WD231_03610 [Candidatus Woykebacteria bacterium]